MEAEDYDVAKQLKQNIDRMRLSSDVQHLPGRTSPPLWQRKRSCNGVAFTGAWLASCIFTLKFLPHMLLA